MAGSGPAARVTLGRDLRAGAIVSATTLLNATAYAAFLAGGPIGSLLPTILASTLVATAVVSLIAARAYSLPSALGGPAGNAAAVAGAALAAVVARDASRGVRSADVAVVLALTAFLPGIVMLALAAARLGRAIRFVPYPVVAGFLAGTGWLLLVGAVRTAGPLGPVALTIACTIGLRLVFARWKKPQAFPLAAACAIAGTWLAFALARVSPDAARAGGWLFARLPAAGPAVVTPAAIWSADWPSIAAAWPAFAWGVIVVVLVSMLNGSLLELETGVDEAPERDLAVLGAANLVVAGTGGFGSQLVLPTSLAANKLAPGSRVPGYVVAVAALACTPFSAGVLPFLPRPVFAAIIAFYGLRFLEQYLIDASRAMTRGETAIVVAMVAATAFLGLETALFAGLALACVAFVSAASRFPVVRRETTLRLARSRTERAAVERATLDARGDAVRVVRLQGHLFFGSTSAIDATLRPLVDREPRCRAIVLDFALVEGIDVSAALGFAKLERRARRRGISLAFAGTTDAMEAELRGNGALAATEPRYADLDAALEAHERLLLADGAPPAASVPAPGELAAPGEAAGFAEKLLPFVETLALPEGERLFAHGDVPDAMYVIVSGTLAVSRDGVRLRTLVPGALVGEMGFYTDEPRSADVVALGAVRVERISRESFARIAREAPDLLAHVHREIVRLQAERLRSANAETLALHV